MFEDEAKWISFALNERIQKSEPVKCLNVGSSTRYFREVEQPYINRIFCSNNESVFEVVHLDLKEGDGVDIVGSIMDQQLRNKIVSMGFNVILCSNMLEHVQDVVDMCKNLSLCLLDNGVLIITVPYVYPYHNDPIDTMFRPSPTEVTALFPNMKVLEEQLLEIKDSHARFLLRNKKALLIFLLRLFTPFYKFENWKKIVSGVPTLFAPFKVSCVMLQKTE